MCLLELAILGMTLSAADASPGVLGLSPREPAAVGVDGELIRLADEDKDGRYRSVVNELRDWLLCQNQHDVERYREFYAEDFEGVQTTRRGPKRLRRAAWLKEAVAQLEETKKVSISDVLIIRPEVEASSALMQVDFRQHRTRDDDSVEVTLRRMSFRWCSSTVRKTCIRIHREDTLAAWPIGAAATSEPSAAGKPVYAVVAGVHANPKAAEQARTKYLKANLPVHDDFPKLSPTADLGLPPSWGTALVVALPEDQRVGTILADFITESGTAAFIHKAKGIRGEDLHLAIIDPHRVTVGDLPRVVSEVGSKLPKLRWEIHQMCDGCRDLTPRGMSVAAKSNGTVLPYTIRREKSWSTDLWVEAKLPSPLAEKSQEWGYYGLGFDWRPLHGDAWSRAANHLKDVEAAVVRVSPGTMRLTDDPPEGD